MKQIHIREELCSGCKLCQQICAIFHFKELNPKKSAVRIENRFPVPGGYTPRLCDQCGDCERVCPAGAIEKRDGAYLIDPDLCILCEECVAHCSQAAIQIPNGVDIPIKCDLCLKCTEICNTGALAAVSNLDTRKESNRCTDSVERPCV